MFNLKEFMESFNIGDMSDGYHTFNELYEHRNLLFCFLCTISEANGINSYKCKRHSDGTVMEGWFVAYLELAEGKQISYHLPDRLWGMCGAKEVESVEWDGHVSSDVLNRLRESIDLSGKEFSGEK